MVNMTKKLVIQSVKEDGGRFRPSDWIERLAANMGTFGADHRLHYSPTVLPEVVDGEKCLVVDPVLEKENPEAFNFIIDFARSNRLKYQEV